MNALRQLAHWTANTGTHPQAAVDWATIAVVDTIGCMIGGSDHPSPRLAYKTASKWGSGSATVVGQSQPLAAPWAAFVNGAAAHALDFNPWDEPSASHSSPVLLAALLAIAEEEGKSGAEVIDAFIVGMEVLMRISMAVNLDHYNIGWHTTSTVSTIGCAAACARLLGLDEEAMGHAISIATSHAGGFKSQFGTLLKPIHCGMAAKGGVLSAYLAQSGVAAAEDTLDGRWSLLTLQTSGNAPGFEQALADLGTSSALIKHGIIIKPYPSCAYTHRSIDGLLDLRAEHGFTAETVAHITARIPYYNASILPYTQPTDDAQARFSMAYCLAIALLNGAVQPADFDDEVIYAPITREWLERITLEPHPVHEHSNDLTTQEPAVVTVTLHDGTVLTKEVDFARGMPQRPLTREELEQKFLRLTQDKLGQEPSQQLVAKLWRFAQAKSMGQLLTF